MEKPEWQQKAWLLVSDLWKQKGAKFFYQKVDAVKLQIPDYYTIIKKPMDFGTIKKKITKNVYESQLDFISDLNQVFINCKMYNGTTSMVGQIGVRIHNEAQRLLAKYGFVEDKENVEQDKRA